MTEILDDSILNADGTNPGDIAADVFPLDEAQIDELLADPVEENSADSEKAVINEEAVLENDEIAILEEPKEESLKNNDVEMIDVVPVEAQSAEDEEVDPDDVERAKENSGGQKAQEEAVGEVELFNQIYEFMQNNLAGTGEEVLDIDDDIQIYEDQEMDDDQIIIEEDAGEGTSRKRTTNGTGPQAKRKRVFPFFAARTAAVDMITRLLGSWDAQITVPHLRLLKEMNLDKFRSIHEIQKKTIDELVQANKALKEQLTKERIAHGNSIKAIGSYEKIVQDMRQQIDELQIMVTQPRCITIFDDVPPTRERIEENQREVAEMEETEFRNGPSASGVPPNRRPQMVPSQKYQPIAPAPSYQYLPQQRYNGNQHSSSQQVPMRRDQNGRPFRPMPPRQGFQGAPMVLPDGSLPSVRGRTAAQAQALLARAGMAPPIQQQQRSHYPVPAPGGPRFAAIPMPTGMGHLEGTTEPRGPQQLIDLTKPTDITIKLLIPFVPASTVISTGDSSRLPSAPGCFSHLAPCPDLTVTITSSQQDFRENWQIGGKINYEYLGYLEDTTVQVFIQVGSLKFNGMHGYTDPSSIPINWGVSQQWECKMKAHKFRVLFHQKQLIPYNDRITVFVVARNEANGTTQVSAPVFMALQ